MMRFTGREQKTVIFLTALIISIAVWRIVETAVNSEPKENFIPAAKTSLIINVNTASWEELQALPHIGPRSASLIIQYREKTGTFKKAEDLLKIKGIGERKLERLKDHVSF